MIDRAGIVVKCGSYYLFFRIYSWINIAVCALNAGRLNARHVFMSWMQNDRYSLSKTSVWGLVHEAGSGIIISGQHNGDTGQNRTNNCVDFEVNSGDDRNILLQFHYIWSAINQTSLTNCLNNNWNSKLW